MLQFHLQAHRARSQIVKGLWIGDPRAFSKLFKPGLELARSLPKAPAVNLLCGKRSLYLLEFRPEYLNAGDELLHLIDPAVT